jgi:ketosteroid isomerase-like protein
MSPSEVAHAFLDVVQQKEKRIDAVLELFAEDGVLDEPMSGIHRGIDAIRRSFVGQPAIRNLKITQEKEEGNVVNIHSTLDADGYGAVVADWKFTVVGDKIARLSIWAQ